MKREGFEWQLMKILWILEFQGSCTDFHHLKIQVITGIFGVVLCFV